MQALSYLITRYADLLTQASASAASRISLEQDSVLSLRSRWRVVVPGQARSGREAQPPGAA
jgi:hypothetical protein